MSKILPRTPQQEKAINAKESCIVSASAGSGKTSVLTERVVKNIANGYITNLDQLLIITFTNAAAAEMRERIKEQLKDDPKTIKFIPLIDSCNICTFDSYFLNLVKKYFYLLNISPDINIISEDILKVKSHILLKKVFNSLVENSRKNNDENIKELILNYTNNKVDDLYYFIERMYDVIVLLPEDQRENYLRTFNDSKLICTKGVDPTSNKPVFKIGDALINYRENYLNPAIGKMMEQFIQSYYSHFKKTNDEAADAFRIKILERIRNISSLDELILFLQSNDKSFISKQIKNKTNFEKKILEIINSIYEWACEDNRYIANDLQANARLIPYIIQKIIKPVYDEVEKFKQETCYYTFNDIALMSLKLLKQHPEVATKIKQNLKLIMVDEYQDTSITQQEFIELIKNNNVFYVGDVKQSIYSFRDAYPEEFKNQCKILSSYGDDSYIGMNDNFRSRKEVIDQINTIFSRFNDGTFEYKQEDFMKYPDIPSYPEREYDKSKYGVFYLEYNPLNVDDPFVIKKGYINKIANDIISRVKNQYEIYDKKAGVYRPCQFKDFAILCPKKSNFSFIEKVFMDRKVPINAIYDIKVQKDVSVTVLINLLNLISFINRDLKLSEIELDQEQHLFISIARSFIGMYDDHSIYCMCQNNAWMQDKLFKQIKEFASEHKNCILSDIYLDLIKEFNFIDKLSNLKGKDTLEILNINNLFYNKTLEMDNLGLGINDFIEYLNELDELDLDMKLSRVNPIENSVLLTTIHKSKGLEFPIVYLAFLEEDSKKDLDNSKFFVDRDLGFWLPSLHYQSNKTIHSVFREFYPGVEEREKGEKSCLLYVAATRARDVLIIAVNDDKLSSLKGNKSTLLNMFWSNSMDIKALSPFTDISDEYIYEEQEKKSEIDKSIIVKQFNYKFKDLPVKRRASSYVSSKVNKEVLEQGSHYHLLFESIDFKTKDTSHIKNPKDKEIIDKVLSNKIFNNVSNANIYQEYSFYDDINNTVGVIDLLIEYDDHIDIVDYKLKDISDVDGKYLKQLTIYKNYINGAFKKTTNCYLLSILNNEVKEINN